MLMLQVVENLRSEIAVVGIVGVGFGGGIGLNEACEI